MYVYWFLSMVSFGMEDFAEKYGSLQPSQFVDVISLVGDKSDNIPGYFHFVFLWKFKWEGRKVINFYFYFYRISVQLLTFSYSMIFDALFYEYHLISMNSISSYRKHLVIAWYLMNGNKSISSDEMKFSDFSL